MSTHSSLLFRTLVSLSIIAIPAKAENNVYVIPGAGHSSRAKRVIRETGGPESHSRPAGFIFQKNPKEHFVTPAKAGTQGTKHKWF